MDGENNYYLKQKEFWRAFWSSRGIQTTFDTEELQLIEECFYWGGQLNGKTLDENIHIEAESDFNVTVETAVSKLKEILCQVFATCWKRESLRKS